MNHVIIEFLSQYIALTEKEIDLISEQNLIRSYKKGGLLLAEGDMATECYFILKGCVYSYCLVEGEIKVTGFFTEKQAITPVSYTTKTPSEYYLECLENCIISIGTPEGSEELMRKVPRLAGISTAVLGDQIVRQQMKYDDFIKRSPEKRYQYLLEKSPDLVNRVPQYLIASYLGIKPESLSRIRKRLNG